MRRKASKGPSLARTPPQAPFPLVSSRLIPYLSRLPCLPRFSSRLNRVKDRLSIIDAYAVRWRDCRPGYEVGIAELCREHGFTEQMAAHFLRIFDEVYGYLIQGPSKVAADHGPDPETHEVVIVLRGRRLELTADVDLAGLDYLRESLTSYQKILQVLTPDQQVGSDIR